MLAGMCQLSQNAKNTKIEFGALCDSQNSCTAQGFELEKGLATERATRDEAISDIRREMQMRLRQDASDHMAAMQRSLAEEQTERCEMLAEFRKELVFCMQQLADTKRNLVEEHELREQEKTERERHAEDEKQKLEAALADIRGGKLVNAQANFDEQRELLSKSELLSTETDAQIAELQEISKALSARLDRLDAGTCSNDRADEFMVAMGDAIDKMQRRISETTERETASRAVHQEVDGLQKDIAEMRETMTNCQRSEAVIERVHQDLDSLQNRLYAEISEVCENSKAVSSRLDKQCAEANGNFQRLEAAIVDVASKLEDVHADDEAFIASVKDTISCLQNQLNAAITEAKNDSKGLTTRLDSVSAGASGMKENPAALETLSKRVEELHQCTDELKIRFNGMSEDRLGLQSVEASIGELQGSISTMQKRADAAMVEMKELGLSTRSEDVSGNNVRFVHIETSIKELWEAIRDIKASLEALSLAIPTRRLR
eukprot:gnl/TRDRNA2_/TRDRNA2_164105_c3_seq1.p1 gnl/TRDRNA2_/TRDRNA2_164105_c3~~gnl/TRDRNA2_/TRDRNA2_164105_c3_seq1.p1  ORF type:complete len:490 (+),score=107.76 gnl/TRDRNA2_/TRDRNA2_164105_c3_seq1:3-1472(+)